MLLTCAVDHSFASAAMHPALVPGEFFQLGRVCLLELGIGICRLVQHAIERLDLLLKLLCLPISGQQPLMALLGIIGQVIHNAHGCNNQRP